MNASRVLNWHFIFKFRVCLFEMTDSSKFCSQFMSSSFWMPVDYRIDTSFSLFRYTSIWKILNDRFCEVLRQLKSHLIFYNTKMSSSFKSRYVRKSSFDLTLYFQFLSVCLFRKFEMTDSAKFCSQFMSRRFSSRHLRQKSFKMILDF